MALLVTGGTGFLGQAVASEYVRTTEGRVVLLSTGRRRPDRSLLESGNVELTVGDIVEFDQVDRICERFGIDRIAHLAAFSTISSAQSSPLAACETNVRGTYNVLEVARRRGIRRVVFAGSGAAYGRAKSPVGENHPLDPLDLYGTTKVMAELICARYRESFDLDVLINRLYFIYGVGMTIQPISPFSMVRDAVEGKPTVMERGADQPFEFAHVRDAAKGVVLSLLADSTRLEDSVFNISAGKVTTLGEFARLVMRLLPGAEIRIGPGDLSLPRAFPLDIRRARAQLGFDPSVPLEQGVREVIDWLASRGSTQGGEGSDAAATSRDGQ